MTRYNDLTFGGSQSSAYGAGQVSRPAPGLSMLGKGPLLPGPGEGGKTRIDRARMKGQASGAARLAAARVAAKNAAAQSNPKFLMAKGVKPLPGIGNMPPRLRG